MSQFLYFSSLAANILANLAILFLLFTQTHNNVEFVIVSLFLLPPLLSIAAIFKLQDIEERRLEKKIRKIQLQQELENLKKHP